MTIVKEDSHAKAKFSCTSERIEKSDSVTTMRSSTHCSPVVQPQHLKNIVLSFFPIVWGPLKKLKIFVKYPKPGLRSIHVQD